MTVEELMRTIGIVLGYLYAQDAPKSVLEAFQALEEFMTPGEEEETEEDADTEEDEDVDDEAEEGEADEEEQVGNEYFEVTDAGMIRYTDEGEAFIIERYLAGDKPKKIGKEMGLPDPKRINFKITKLKAEGKLPKKEWKGPPRHKDEPTEESDADGEEGSQGEEETPPALSEEEIEARFGSTTDAETSDPVEQQPKRPTVEYDEEGRVIWTEELDAWLREEMALTNDPGIITRRMGIRDTKEVARRIWLEKKGKLLTV